MSIIKLAILSIAVFGSFRTKNVESARVMFHSNLENESGLNSFLKAYEDSKDPSIAAYIGVATTMKASHTLYPNSKLKFFKQGKKKIESSIMQEPKNIEIRYSRLLVQLNAPSFLLYNSDIQEDLKMFEAGIRDDSMSFYWKKKLISNLFETDQLSKTQQELLNNINLN